MKYLKKFETSVLLEDFKLTDNYETPNVYMLSDMTLEFNNYHDYSQDYLTLVALEDCEFSFKFLGTSDYGGYYVTQEMWERIAYSIDNGETWTELINPGNLADTGLTTPTIHKGEKVIWKGIGTKNYRTAPVGAQYGNHCYFSSTGRYNIEGNILSIAYSDNFKNQTSLTGTDHIFSAIFAKSKNLISAKNLILSATTLGDDCYYCMFAECSSLISIPKLPATTLSKECYSWMFRDCTSLTTAPELPATTLASSCYQYMFTNCKALTTAPELPATTLADSCYSGMFDGCTSLNYVKCLATNISASDCTNRWLTSVSSTGTFAKDSSMTSWASGESGIPSGWTITNV